jgi:hypothetical protein
MGAGETEPIAQGVNEEQTGFDVELVLGSVHVQAHVDGAAHSLSSSVDRRLQR